MLRKEGPVNGVERVGRSPGPTDVAKQEDKMEHMDHTRIKARVTGRVQGVGYRAWVAEQARGLHLNGWAKNESDGSVTVLVSGREDDVHALLKGLQYGPEGAEVAFVATEPAGEEPAAGFAVV